MSERREMAIQQSMMLIFMARIMQKEYGEEALVKLAEWKDQKTRQEWKEIADETGRSDPEYLLRIFSSEFTEGTHEFEIIHKEKFLLEVKVTKCLYAEVFREHNAADIGRKLFCQGDHAVVEGFNPEIKFSRPEMLMAGDKCCYFRFELS